MGFALPPSYLNATKYSGDQLATVPCVNVPRAPVSTDVNYPLLTIWRNNNVSAAPPDALGDIWYLAKFVAGTPPLADWVKLTAGGGGSTVGVETLSDTSSDKANPDALGNIAILGGTSPITTDVGANSVSIYVQTASEIAAPDASKVGLAAFSDTFFAVDATGFVTLKSSASMIWQNVDANATLAVANGYFCVAPGGGLQLTLPAVSNPGDTIEVTLDGATSWEIRQPNAASQIYFAGQDTTLGVDGTLTSQNDGDSVRLICETANARWVALSPNVLLVG